MSEQNFIPALPESAPFTPEQRVYLNGFFAGLYSRVPAAATTAPATAAKPLAPLTILFGSQTGNAENLARRIAKEAGQRGFAPTVHDPVQYPSAQLASETRLLIVTSTYGDGEPPDNAKAFWESLCSGAAPTLAQLGFSVCALGDTNYPKFCGFGKDVDARLEALGAQRMHPRADCDVEYEEPFTKWLDGALGALAAVGQPLTPTLSPLGGERENRIQSRGKLETDDSTAANGIAASGGRLSPLPRGEGQGEGTARIAYSRANPFPATLMTNRKLNSPGSCKDTRHFEIALEGSDLIYEAGDALGVVPANCPELVAELLVALKCAGDEAVPGRDGAEVALREALLRHYEITKIPTPFLQAMAERSSDDTLKKLAAPGTNGELTQFLWGREIIDLLLAHPALKFSPIELVGLLKKLQPRLYSISSSLKAHPGEVHLTVDIVRYESLGRARKGVCSTFLAERVAPDVPVPVFVQPNRNFRPPPAGDTPMIMVGPGTGIAPFRAFLQERKATGATGRNWLFFGAQHARTDFLYREELEAMRLGGTLTRLDTAFSRDREPKTYVQHLMLEHALELFAWLEAGAHFYVCGDASRMAKDVDAALHKVVEIGGGRELDAAAEYVRQLKNEKRYQRDVY